jgi:hypothetical protein
MQTATYQTLTEDKSEKIEEILLDLGYQLSDRGKYWQAKALYRDGDNPTALQIWKNTGIWKDFVANTNYQPFNRLLQLSCKDDAKISEIIESMQNKNECFIPVTKTPKMETEHFFDHDEVKTLLPHYNFYNKKKISDKTLKMYHSGFSMSGKMNGRFVFPVYDNNNKVIGLSGRHLLWEQNQKLAKWKHLGKKANWIYPINLKTGEDNLFLQTIEKKKEIILIEGIGDSLALTEQNYFNHMVIFGLELSSKQLSYLISLNLNKIIISTNNDKNKVQNRGLEAAIKNYLKLIKFFDVDKIQIKLPIAKDFGEMLENEIDIKEWENKSCVKELEVKYIIKYVTNNMGSPTKYRKQIKTLKNYLEQLNFETNSISK